MAADGGLVSRVQTRPPSALRGAPDYPSSGDWLHRLAQAWTLANTGLSVVATAAAFLTLMVFAVYAVWRED